MSPMRCRPDVIATGIRPIQFKILAVLWVTLWQMWTEMLHILRHWTTVGYPRGMERRAGFEPAIKDC